MKYFKNSWMVVPGVLLLGGCADTPKEQDGTSV